MLTGSLPSSAVSPDSVSFQPSPSGGEAEVLQPHRLEPRERHVDLGRVDLLERVGDPGLLPERGGGVAAGLRVDLVALGGRGRLGAHHGAVDPGRVGSTTSAVSSSAITSAQAPSEDGQVSSYRIGSQSICEASTDSTVVSWLRRWA